MTKWREYDAASFRSGSIREERRNGVYERVWLSARWVASTDGRQWRAHTSIKCAFHVQHGSSGDCHAIVTQLHTMVIRMAVSNHPLSTMNIMGRRGQELARMQQSARP